jgi:hypothetical protein
VSFVTRIVLHEVFELMLSIVTISVLNWSSLPVKNS